MPTVIRHVMVGYQGAKVGYKEFTERICLAYIAATRNVGRKTIMAHDSGSRTASTFLAKHDLLARLPTHRGR